MPNFGLFSTAGMDEKSKATTGVARRADVLDGDRLKRDEGSSIRSVVNLLNPLRPWWTGGSHT